MKQNSRRLFLLSLIGLIGAKGCSNSPLIQSTTDALDLFLNGYPSPPLSRQQVDAIPYATIGVKIGQGPNSMLVLGREDNGDLHWISADRAVLVTRAGHLVRTVGLGTNLHGTGYINQPIMPKVNGAPIQTSYRREIDIEQGNQYQVEVTATLQYAGEEQIEILGTRHQTFKIQEYGWSPLLQWRYVNTYWVEPGNGFIWRSEQHFLPSLPPAVIEVLKPASLI